MDKFNVQRSLDIPGPINNLTLVDFTWEAYLLDAEFVFYADGYVFDYCSGNTYFKDRDKGDVAILTEIWNIVFSKVSPKDIARYIEYNLKDNTVSFQDKREGTDCFYLPIRFVETYLSKKVFDKIMEVEHAKNIV